MRVLIFFKQQVQDLGLQLENFFGAAQMPANFTEVINLFTNNTESVYLQTVETQRTEPIPYEFMR